ncbi:MAG: T9SS type A sorting domain-containing protein, partial [Rhodothermia bacterium]|nr:T9SS type A sorting domain-containing protein [Rhodothermia bacterium]
RVRLVEYALNGVPGWLSASPPKGTVAPADASAVSFLVSDTLAIGQYTATILAENDGLPAQLNLTVDVSCPSPGWGFDPSRFSYSMDLTAQLSMEGIPSSDTADRLAAFVGDELRGTGTANTSGIVQMTIYSPLPAGETVTFRALDASACRLYPATDLILPFVNGTSQGNPSSPIAIDAMNNAPQQSVALAKGWTWFSINRTPSSTDPDDVLATLAPANSDVLKSQTAFSLFDGATRSWVGALNDVKPGTGYMVKLSGPNSLVVMGTPVDPLVSPIDVTPGWNWIGYHPQGSQSLDEALGSLTNKDTSDLVKSQYGFAQWDGSRWIGSLQTMDPGLGYMIKRANDGTIVYPNVPAGPTVRVAPNRPAVSDETLARLGKNVSVNDRTDEAIRETESSGGTINLSFKRTSQIDTRDEQRGLRVLSRDYERSAFNMTVTAEVQIDDQPANRPVFVGAFVDDEPRGLARATYVESLDAYRVFLMVYSDELEGETITFRVLDDDTEQFYDLNQTTPFESDAILGSPAEPVVLDNRASGKLAVQEELPTEFALRQNYPNPFNPTTTIKYDVPAQSDVRIVLYDVLGREVRRLVNGNQKAGRYEIVFDASLLASGTYFYRMQAGDFQALHKMIVLK